MQVPVSVGKERATCGKRKMCLIDVLQVHPTVLLRSQAVVSDVPSCGGVSYAKDQGIATLTYPASKKGLFPGLSAEELVQQLTETHAADYVLLAGYLKVRPGLPGG